MSLQFQLASPWRSKSMLKVKACGTYKFLQENEDELGRMRLQFYFWTSTQISTLSLSEVVERG